MTKLSLSSLKLLFLILLSCIVVGTSNAYANDPTRPPGMGGVVSTQETPKKTSFTLQQIKVSADSRSAVINGQLVKESDSVAGAKVVKITSDKVVLKYRKKLRSLSLINRTKHSEK